MLSIRDHRRDSAGMNYVYPVISRRAGGVSVGINLNINNACNWACRYCQVPNLTRGGPLPIDMGLLGSELRGFLREAVHGDFLEANAPQGAQRLVDVAFSGNGEPTSAPEFAAAVDLVGVVLREFGLQEAITVRLITNGSLMHRPVVCEGIERIGKLGGEVWFKLDRATEDGIERVNSVRVSMRKVRESLARCAGLAPTWVQTCYFAVDGAGPEEVELQAYLELLFEMKEKIKGVLLYGIARPSMQPDAARLSSLSGERFATLAARISDLGLAVVASP